MRNLKKPNREDILNGEIIAGNNSGALKGEKASVKQAKTGGNNALTRNRVLHIINKYTIISAAIGAVPIPGADVLAVSAVQADMVEEIALEFGLRIPREWGRQIVVVLTGSMALSLGAKAAFSSLKALPLIGTVFGGGSSIIASAVTTYSIGRVLEGHFSRGGTLNASVIPKLSTEAARYAGIVRNHAYNYVFTT